MILLNSKVLSHLGKDEELIRFVPDRPGHDRRYAVDSSKLRNEIGWKPLYDFEAGLQQTVDWYRGNVGWLKGVKRS
jgi:dTDP-glucose 4,6-dehydratase